MGDYLQLSTNWHLGEAAATIKTAVIPIN